MIHCELCRLLYKVYWPLKGPALSQLEECLSIIVPLCVEHLRLSGAILNALVVVTVDSGWLYI